MNDSTSFPRIPYSTPIVPPQRTSRDSSPITNDQIETVEQLIRDINRFITSSVSIDSDFLDEMGSAQANKLIRVLKQYKETVLTQWRKHLYGKTETLKGKGYRIKVKITRVDQEPSRKQIGYLKHLLEEAGVHNFPEYLFYALGKWEISDMISQIKGEDTDDYSDTGTSQTSPAKEKATMSTGCGCLIILISTALIIWAITHFFG